MCVLQRYDAIMKTFELHPSECRVGFNNKTKKVRVITKFLCFLKMCWKYFCAFLKANSWSDPFSGTCFVLVKCWIKALVTSNCLHWVVCYILCILLCMLRIIFSWWSKRTWRASISFSFFAFCSKRCFISYSIVMLFCSTLLSHETRSNSFSVTK